MTSSDTTRPSSGRSGDTTGFQERAPYDEAYDLRTDFVMAYGLDASTPGRIERWREAGYRVHLMTGISWGTYQDYLEGDWDGNRHWDDAQTESDGSPILHGNSTDIPYMVPTITFTEYLIEKLRPVIALGVEGIHLEEPEFWARGGYSPSFKREWQAYYGEPWEPPHGSAEAHFRSGRLKQHLLTRSLDRVTTVLRDEALRQGHDLRFYVPTHSLLNYTQWQIVSPESRLRDLVSVHGAIAQVWTGTSRTPNVYGGRLAERTFETAYLEYGIAQDLTRGTDDRLWFLHDPIEDHSGRTWEDYRANYQRTLVASLLHPGVSRYEVAPWPHRIFTRPYLRDGSDERVPIPADYATSYLVAMQSLRDLDQPDVEWAGDGPRIGVFLSDTAMFQRWRPEDASTGDRYDGLQNALTDEGRAQLNFSEFYGLALPPLFDGQRVTPVQLENVVNAPGVLDDYDVLVLSYEFQKPLTSALHYALAGWVQRGGCLLYVGDGADPYHELREWWTASYQTCAHHLAEAVGFDLDTDGPQPVGRGWAQSVRQSPATFAASPEAAADLVTILHRLAESGGHDCTPAPWLSVRRGPYLVGAVLSEATAPVRVEGRYLDLLDPELAVVRERELAPGAVTWMRDLSHAASTPELLASAGRLRNWSDRTAPGDQEGQGTLSFVSEAPSGIEVLTAVRVASEPTEVLADGAVTEWWHDPEAGVLWVRHAGVPGGTPVTISW